MQAVLFHFHPLCAEITLSMGFFSFAPENIKENLTFPAITKMRFFMELKLNF